MNWYLETQLPAAAGFAPARGALSPPVSDATLLFLLAPTLVYLSSLWLVRPVTVSQFSPVILLLSPLTIAVSRRYILDRLRRLGLEFSLLLIMLVLSLLSLANHSEPFRSLRIIFPCVLPFLLFIHLSVVGFVSRDWLLRTPRLLIATCLLFAVFPFLVSFVLPPLKSFLFPSYRLRGLFENSIQHAIALSAVIPLAVTELALSRRRTRTLFWGGVIAVLAYTLFRTGSKTALFVSITGGSLLFGALRLRYQSVFRTLVMVLAFISCALFLWAFGLRIAEQLDPIVAAKIRSIVEGGVSNYQSVESRKLLWREAISQGNEHWLVGSGAGEKVFGISHAHNLVIDYFKGIGMFGAASVVLLCLAILARTARKGIEILRGIGTDDDRRILACYVASSIYVTLNQMSDCFGPSTIGFLWAGYLTGVLADRPRAGFRSGRQL